jgi:hypothetical protein
MAFSPAAPATPDALPDPPCALLSFSLHEAMSASTPTPQANQANEGRMARSIAETQQNQPKLCCPHVLCADV